MKLFLSEQPHDAEERDREFRKQSGGKKRSRFGMDEEKPGLVVQPLPPPLFLPCVVLDPVETAIIRHQLPKQLEIRDQIAAMAAEKRLEMVWVYPVEPKDEKDMLFSMHFAKAEPKKPAKRRYDPS